jgi:UDP-N-acetylmuramoyl-tripeptide--D-alanyl-D-alanine ligase
MTFGSAAADLKAEQVQSSLKGFSMQVIVADQSVRFQLPHLPLPPHYAQTFLAAIAVAKTFNIPLQSAVSSLQSNFHLPPGRLSLIPGLKNSLILDSSYNASRAPMIAALNLLDQIAPARRVAVLGDMRELGQSAEIEHHLVARTAVKTCDLIVAVGPLMKQYLVPEVLRLGFPQQNLYHFTNAYQAANFLKKRLIQNQDTILVKGSQNMIFLEIVVQALMKNPQDSDRLLCRRGKFWDKKRRALR